MNDEGAPDAALDDAFDTTDVRCDDVGCGQTTSSALSSLQRVESYGAMAENTPTVVNLPTADAVRAPAVTARASEPARDKTSDARAQMPRETSVQPDTVRDFVVRAQANTAWLVAWGVRHTYRSRDEGRSWETLDVALPEYARGQSALADDGTVYTAGEVDRLTVIAPDGTRAVQRMSFSTAVFGLYTRGDSLVWMGKIAHSVDGPEWDEHALYTAESSDHGAHWTAPREIAREHNSGDAFAWSEDGRLYQMSASEAGCGGGMQQFEVLEPGATQFTSLEWDMDAPGAWALASAGHAYAWDDARNNGLVLVDTKGSHRLMTIEPDPNAYRFSAVGGFGVDYVQVSSRVVRVRDGRAMTVSRDLPNDAVLQAVDARGRLLVTLGGVLQRWENGRFTDLTRKTP